MMLLSSVIDQFESDFLNTYQHQILPRHKKALKALQICRTTFSPVMQVSCTDCDHQRFVPHSCGHRNCPHCQHHESQLWIENQLKKQLPGDHFMITFTLPAQLRPLAWDHQKANEAEMRVIEALREMGNEALTAWGEPQISTLAESQKKKDGYYQAGKKNSAGIRHTDKSP